MKSTLPETIYLNSLLADLARELKHINDRPIVSIYCGGGTPSLFSPSSIKRLLDAMRLQCNFAPDIEITIEANPGAADSERFKGYIDAGINRISIGAQSFQDDALTRIGRIHQGDTATQAIEAAIQAGFKNFNIDLMHGLPGQSVAEGLEDLAVAFKFAPPHLSWYHLTVEPNTFFASQPPNLPTEETIWDLQDQGAAQLAQAGFAQYEISAFSQPGFECRHNLNYWTFGDYIGIGAGAHSKLTHLQQQKILRYWKVKHPKAWLVANEHLIGGQEVLTKDQLPFEFMLNALRSYQTIDCSLFEQRTGLPFATLTSSLTCAANKGLVYWTNEYIKPTELGRRFYTDLVSLFLK